MSSPSHRHDQQHLDSVFLHALQALPAADVPVVESRISACPDCRHEMETLRPVIRSFAFWPSDLLRPSASLWERVAQRTGVEGGAEPMPAQRLADPEWEAAGPGISVKLLATDTEQSTVSMLVRLAPGAEYPPHRHAGVEELHLLDGELMVDDRKLYPGDHIRAEADTVDHRVWSETGCTCVLLTSARDVLL